MSEILKKLNKAQEEKLARDSMAAADSPDLTNPSGSPASMEYDEEIRRSEIVCTRSKPSQIHYMVQEFERLQSELLELQEKQKDVMLRIRDVLDQLKAPARNESNKESDAASHEHEADPLDALIFLRQKER